jgi:exoribonuclease II
MCTCSVEKVAKQKVLQYLKNISTLPWTAQAKQIFQQMWRAQEATYLKAMWRSSEKVLHGSKKDDRKIFPTCGSHKIAFKPSVLVILVLIVKDMISVENTIDPKIHLFNFVLRALGSFTNHCKILFLL